MVIPNQLEQNTEPMESNGLFDGSNVALAQLDIRLSDRLRFGVTYVRSYYPQDKLFVSASTGSTRVNAPYSKYCRLWQIHLKKSRLGRTK